MRLSNLLENSTKPSLKEVTHFLYNLQDLLISEFPNFKTEIKPQTLSSSDFPLSIRWHISDYEMEITGEMYVNSLTIWFKIPIIYISIKLPLTAFKEAEELNFNVNDLLSKKLFSDNLDIPYNKVLQACNDGEIPSIRSYLK